MVETVCDAIGAAVEEAGDAVVGVARDSGVLYVDVSGLTGPGLFGVLLGLTVPEVSAAGVEGGTDVRFAIVRLEGGVLADVTPHFEAARALIWVAVCARNPSYAAAERAVRTARCAGLEDDVGDLEWFREYARMLTPALAGEVAGPGGAREGDLEGGPGCAQACPRGGLLSAHARV
ncbi:hypothetical protein [Methanopyrus kandleri]